MRQKVVKINIPLTFDEHIVNQLTGKIFENEKKFINYCQDAAAEMVKKACESDAIFYMMEIEPVVNPNDIN